MLPLSEKTNCDTSTCLHINFTSYVKASFSSTFPTESTSLLLVENQINTKSSAVISWVLLVLGVSNKSSVISVKFFKHIRLKKKLTFCSILLLFFISVIFTPFAMFLLYSFYSYPCKCFLFKITLYRRISQNARLHLLPLSSVTSQSWFWEWLHIFWWIAIFAMPKNSLCYTGASKRNRDLLVRKPLFHSCKRWWLKILFTEDRLCEWPYTRLSKAVVIFFAEKEALYAAFVNDARSWIVITLPGLAVIKSCCAMCNFLLHGPITPSSSGCSQWEQWGRKATKVIPFSLA